MNPVLQKIELTFEEATQVANKLGQFAGGLVYEELHLIVSKLKSSALESLNNTAPVAAAVVSPLADSTSADVEQIADNAVASIVLAAAPSPTPIPAVETLEAATTAPVAVAPVDVSPVDVAPAMNIPG